MIKILERIYIVTKRDYLSGEKVHPRDDLERVGSEYGGWVIPADLIGPDSICYCAGCGEDITFDLGLIERFGCHVYAFDPTPRAIEHVKKTVGKNDKYHFSEIGLWNEKDKLKFYAPKKQMHVSHSLLNIQNTDEYIIVDVERLSGIMKSLGHEKIDLLKLDIEGAEYSVIDSIIEDGLNVNIVCLEFDEYFNPIDNRFRDRIREYINKIISQNYTMIHKQGNGNYTFLRESWFE
jgi:FkbM family methyltransferase